MNKVIIWLLLFVGQAAMAQQEMKMDHSHMPIALPEEAKPIALSLKLSGDAMSGYNLTLLTDNYLFGLPPAQMTMMEMMSADIDESTGIVEGHAHLYVNGNKIQRIYGKYVHLPEDLFADGVNSVSVTLNNHGHMYWTMQDKKVIATLFINRSSDKLISYRFESFPSKSTN